MTQELRDEARRREAERETLRRERERFAADLQTLARSDAGRRFLRWLVDFGDIFAEEYQPGTAGAYRAGRKAVSVRLWRMLRQHLTRAEFIAVVMGEPAPPKPAIPECMAGTPFFIGENDV